MTVLPARSALTRYSWRQLTRHPARSTLTIVILAFAVVGAWLFAAPYDFDATMNERVEEDRLHDAILFPDGVMLDEDDLAGLRDTPNVEALDARVNYVTEMRVGDRIQDVWLVGVRDFDDQPVNVVDVDSGRQPVAGGAGLEALTDPVNARNAQDAGAVGETVTVRSSRSGFEPVSITGEGGSVYYSHSSSEWIPVLYAPVEVVLELAGYPEVFTQVEYRVDDRSGTALTATTDSIRGQLAGLKPSVEYNALVEVRPDGQWPGEEDFDNFLVLFWVLAGMALFSALVLVSSTMTTLVREEAREIAIMKAVGGRRRRIIGSYLTTGAFLGAGGTVLGTAIGLTAVKLLFNYFGGLMGVTPGWSVSWFGVGLALAVGMGATLLASMPALLRGTRDTVRAGLGQAGADTSFGDSRVDRLLARAHRLPRVTQLGLRAAARRKTRSIATQLQVALAVGTMLGFAGALITIVEISEQSRNAEGGDIELYTSGEGRPLDYGAADVVADVDGVDRVQPIVYAQALVGDTDTFAWGLPPDPVYRYELSDGRWFTAEENDGTARVAVIGPALSEMHGIEVGDAVRAETQAGPIDLEVVGIDTTLVGDGQALFVPIDTIRSIDRRAGPPWYWVTTTSSDTGDIDRVATSIRGELERTGYAFDTDLRYVEREAARREDRTVVAIILGLGSLIVLMGMVGLVSSMTTNVVERTREIGILRSIGARSRDIRRVFRAEAVALVVLGWLTGIVVGYAIGRIIIKTLSDRFDVAFVLRYPLWPIVVALAVTLLVALLVLHWPLRRASKLPPSRALRYE